MNEALTNAILEKLAYKHDEMVRYQAAVILTGLFYWPFEIAADVIPAEFRPSSRTTAGCTFALLKGDGLHLFKRTGRRASNDVSANCRWINTYTLNSRATARAWLRAHGIEVAETDPAQTEMALN